MIYNLISIVQLKCQKWPLKFKKVIKFMKIFDAKISFHIANIEA